MSAPHGILDNHDFNTKLEHNGKTHWVSRPDKSRLNNFPALPVHVGMEGTRTCLFLKLFKQKTTSRDYDVYTFYDEIGNHFVSFGNELKAMDTELTLRTGTCYVVKATIKRHATDSYSNTADKQNHINRLQVIKTIGIKDES